MTKAERLAAEIAATICLAVFAVCLGALCGLFYYILMMLGLAE